jgi:hypothetical protein
MTASRCGQRVATGSPGVAVRCRLCLNKGCSAILLHRRGLASRRASRGQMRDRQSAKSASSNFGGTLHAGARISVARNPRNVGQQFERAHDVSLSSPWSMFQILSVSTHLRRFWEPMNLKLRTAIQA